MIVAETAAPIKLDTLQILIVHSTSFVLKMILPLRVYRTLSMRILISAVKIYNAIKVIKINSGTLIWVYYTNVDIK